MTCIGQPQTYRFRTTALSDLATTPRAPNAAYNRKSMCMTFRPVIEPEVALGQVLILAIGTNK
jgi:hypothetical protein